jgi:hypothetical protein
MKRGETNTLLNVIRFMLPKSKVVADPTYQPSDCFLKAEQLMVFSGSGLGV